MTVLRNNFSSGPDGTKMTPANSGANADDAFNTMNNGSGTTVCAFADAATLGRGTAEFVLKVATGSTSFGPIAIWDASMGAQSQIYMRMYVRYATLPTSTTKPVVFFDSLYGGGTADCAMIGIDKTTYQVYLHDHSTPPAGVSVSTSGAITAGTWFRIECRMQFSTTTGNAELRFYNGDDVDSDVPTETISLTSQNFGNATADTWAFGYVWGDSNWETAYISGLELNNTGWPGPAPFKIKGVPGIQPSPVAIHTAVW